MSDNEPKVNDDGVGFHCMPQAIYGGGIKTRYVHVPIFSVLIIQIWYRCYNNGQKLTKL